MHSIAYITTLATTSTDKDTETDRQTETNRETDKDTQKQTDRQTLLVCASLLSYYWHTGRDCVTDVMSDDSELTG